MYTILHSTVKYMLFSGLHATFLKIYHILSHKTYVDKFKITVIQSMFSNHNMKLEISYREIA